MIINSTQCIPRGPTRYAIREFLEISKLHKPKVYQTSKNVITYLWENFIGKKCYLRVVMDGYWYTCSFLLPNGRDLGMNIPMRYASSDGQVRDKVKAAKWTIDLLKHFYNELI